MLARRGRLRGVYFYNYQNQRTLKLALTRRGLNVTVFHYDLTGNLLAETELAGRTKWAYIWADSRPLAQIDTRTRRLTPVERFLYRLFGLRPPGARERLIYLHTDHLNTPRLATDHNQVIVWRWAGEAFGATPPETDPDGDGRTTTVNLRFPGQYFDSESGLHYNGHRYYDPRIGRYLTPDPTGVNIHVLASLNRVPITEIQAWYRAGEVR